MALFPPHEIYFYNRDFYSLINLTNHEVKSDRLNKSFRNENFTSTSSLSNQHHRQNAENPLHCTECDEHFIIPYELKKHMIKHTKQKKYKCLICSKSFSRQGSLHVHQRIHTDAEPRYQCDLCPKRFYWRSNLSSHRKSHFIVQYDCEICREKFSSQTLLYEHCDRHLCNEQRQQFQCVWCKKMYLNRYNLNHHLKYVHTDLVSFQCDQCNETFRTPIELRHHAFTHPGNVKPYPCSECNRSFLTQQNLKAHENAHNRLKSFQCDLCGSNFRYKRNLYIHLKRHKKHQRSKQKQTRQRKRFDLSRFKCDVCGRGFAYGKSVKNCKHRLLAKGKQQQKADSSKEKMELKVQIEILTENPYEPKVSLWEFQLSSLPEAHLGPAEEILISTASCPSESNNAEQLENISSGNSTVDGNCYETVEFSAHVSSSLRLLQTPSYNDFTNIDSLINYEPLSLDLSVNSPAAFSSLEYIYSEL